MHEIFYRAWHKQEQRMYAVIGLSWSDTCPSELVTVTLHEEKQVDPKEIVLMQYSGVKDQNDVLIYEGHLVQHGDTLGAVVYDNGAFTLDGQLLSELDYLVVIGNRFESQQ
jgi:uncharacterized phage protein (TIGR01671 family)